jgi:hypothetical protein
MMIDRIFVATVPTLFMIGIYYTYSTFWKDTLPSMTMVDALFAYSMSTIYRADTSSIAKVARAMTGLMMIVCISGISLIICTFSWKLISKILVVIPSFVLVYKTQKLFVNQMKCSVLMLAVTMDLALAIFLLTRPNVGLFGLDLGRENH